MVFPERAGRIEPSQRQTKAPVQEPGPQQVATHERPACMHAALQGPATAACAQRLGPQESIAARLAARVFRRVHTVMHQDALQHTGLAIADQALVHPCIGETAALPLEEPQHPVIAPQTVADHLAAVAAAAPQPVASHRRLGRRLAQHPQDLGSQRIRNLLVGIDGQDPAVPAACQRPVLLRAETRPVRRHLHVGPLATCNGHRVVGTARIQHHDLIGKGHALQAPRDAMRLVAGNDGHRQAPGNRQAVGCRHSPG